MTRPAAVLSGDALLDNPGWHSLAGAHARFAEVHGGAARYQPDVSPIHALSDASSPESWESLKGLIPVGGSTFIPAAGAVARPGWEVEFSIPGVQLVDVALAAGPDPSAVRLGAADVPEMLDLVARTKPGPFENRTVELGTYLGLRDESGALIAMAGERMHPPGWTEISAVCTDPGHRGKGLATRLIRAVAAGIRERGETPFLHTGASNTTAIRLYEAIGFTLRRTIDFTGYRRVS
ncbi:GNAT family N-acetyltransferase [Actinoplanes sp. NBRC 101535]|uniref:GNAT family N-acetyltransferase n=1 Tax=Actinoplanes sp. NBRC 101535 TaxID=3032196 RepID=UPI0024A0B04E|nr:GNAT family N-acetyltransferase [Actinoplanes sp. NBRC 101535]GLY00527.1 hypothetical protein Acsp01_09060 [Actinoplanes sp. NBRC 101535]